MKVSIDFKQNNFNHIHGFSTTHYNQFGYDILISIQFIRELLMIEMEDFNY